MPKSGTLLTAAEILQRFYDAETIYMSAPPEARDIAPMAATLAPNVKLMQSPDLPYGGVSEGVQGFQTWAETMVSLFDSLDVSEPQVFEKEDSDTVMVLSTLKLRVRKTGVRLENPLVQRFKVDRRAEVITEIQPFYWNVKELNDAVA